MSRRELPSPTERAQMRASWEAQGLSRVDAQRAEGLQYAACRRDDLRAWNKAINWAFDRIDEARGRGVAA